ncbi:MAG: ribonuclease H-like domain-containing protein [Methanocalculus sp.]|uniref:ribonuclease H-like domain-containing protein n=1 Tax=Methanocalculus sp. TaxID=2004547 RepID=UPI00271729BD|nr:ribonuclease H-like domain-containing protein [Methanocalculus sp.]MDO8841162.1 ribonuclease H-like domain-containing protein [Methanocalculus sp.]MDO9539645.1 ribonuclease H-like domain-containing protein [Methanocalculus sp.]
MGRSAGAFEDASSFWRRCIDSSGEYSVIQHDNRFRESLTQSPVLASVYQRCITEREELSSTYAGCDIGDLIKGTVCMTDKGGYYLISEELGHRGFPLDASAARAELIRCLRLIPGIGPVRERHLKQRGCQTIRDLRYIRRYQADAQRILRCIEDGENSKVESLISERIGRTHPLMITASALSPDENFVFLDIETLGVFSRPVFLIGSASVRDGKVTLNQFLARDIDEELPALLAWQASVPEGATLISYNGRSFDVPYLADRFAYYGIDHSFSKHQIDLLHITRRTVGRSQKNCRLCTIEEQVLGISRESDLPGAMVPEFYDIYRRTKNPGPLIPIVQHNRQDVLSLVDLYHHFRELSW